MVFCQKAWFRGRRLYLRYTTEHRDTVPLGRLSCSTACITVVEFTSEISKYSHSSLISIRIIIWSVLLMRRRFGILRCDRSTVDEIFLLRDLKRPYESSPTNLPMNHKPAISMHQNVIRDPSWIAWLAFCIGRDTYESSEILNMMWLRIALIWWTVLGIHSSTYWDDCETMKGCYHW